MIIIIYRLLVIRYWISIIVIMIRFLNGITTLLFPVKNMLATHIHTNRTHIHTAFLDDWQGEEPSDLLHFVPIDWKVTINLCQYEIFLFTNRYNWVDVDATEYSENTPTQNTFQLSLISSLCGGR